MVEKMKYPGDANDLRRRADDAINRSTNRRASDKEPLTAIQLLAHELKVYQMELEMQNDELRRAHLELEASRAKYFDLYDMAPIGYMTINAQGLILEANLAAATMLGVSRAFFVNRYLSYFVPHEDQTTYYYFRKLLVETGTSQPCDLRLTSKDGSVVWVSLEAVSSHDVKGTSVNRVVLSDITWRKQAAEENMLNDKIMRRLAVAVRDSHDAITVQDLEGRIIAWNPGAVRMYGWSETEALALNVRERIPGWLREDSLASVWQLSQSEVLQPLRTQRITKDGTILEVSIISTALIDAEGQMYAIATTERAVNEHF